MYTKDSSKIVKETAMEYINIQKEMFMKGNSKTIKEMAEESINL